MLIFGALSAGVAFLFSMNYAIFGFVVGAIAGILIGGAVASFVTIVFEWMAQLLVAQGEIVVATKQRKP